MRLLLRIVAIATVPAWLGVHVNSAAAQTFDIDGLSSQRRTQNRRPRHSTRRSKTRPSDLRLEWSRHARKSALPRDLPTGYSPEKPLTIHIPQAKLRVRVTDLASYKSVVVRITDRGPWVRGRVLDLSLGAARSLRITDRGVAQVRAVVL
jgi:rare lipoprotein A